MPNAATASHARAAAAPKLEVPVERAERRHRVGHGRVGRDDVAALVARRADVELAPLPLVVLGTEGVSVAVRTFKAGMVVNSFLSTDKYIRT